MEKTMERIVGRKWTLVTAALGLLLALSLGALGAQGGAAPEKISLDLNLRPGEDSGTYVMTARVRDLSTDLVLAAPHMVFNVGDDSYSTSRLPTGDELRLRVWVPPSEDQTEYEAQILRDGEVVVAQKAKVLLGS
ncbi:MAG: hypothetical protein R3234_04315 [Thermoanaerobaculia bacterium]|nr:hypothetical protein [Thermoanaerobaculia bacterium]